MSRFDDSPGNPYKALIDGLWPRLDDEDPRQHRWDVACREATTLTIAHRPSRDSALKFTDSGQADPLRGPDVRVLLRITCIPDAHDGWSPTLAEVWKTSVGLLFVAKLPGRLLDRGEVPGDPFDPPAAVRNWRKPSLDPRASDPPGSEWVHVPITIVRLLLEDDVDAKLWVKCVAHGPAEVDRAKLYREYEAQRAFGSGNTPDPRYVPLDSVAALSSG